MSDNVHVRGFEKDRPLKTLEAEQDDRDQHATRGEQKFKSLNNDGLPFAMITKNCIWLHRK